MLRRHDDDDETLGRCGVILNSHQVHNFVHGTASCVACLSSMCMHRRRQFASPRRTSSHQAARPLPRHLLESYLTVFTLQPRTHSLRPYGITTRSAIFADFCFVFGIHNVYSLVYSRRVRAPSRTTCALARNAIKVFHQWWCRGGGVGEGLWIAKRVSKRNYTH